jgi:hypothetical protein
MEQPLGQLLQPVPRLLAEHPRALGRLEGGADVHHRLRERPVALLGLGMHHGYLVVVLQRSTREGLVDFSYALHAEGRQLRGSQRPHARRAEDVHSLLHRPEDLLVGHRGHPLEVAVDEPDGHRLAQRRPVQVPLRRRRKVDGVEFPPALLGGERGAGEDDHLHGALSKRRRRARAPGT